MDMETDSSIALHCFHVAVLVSLLSSRLVETLVFTSLEKISMMKHEHEFVG